MRRFGRVIPLGLAAVFVTGFILLRATGSPEAPRQPVEFDHWQHITKEEGPQLDCAFCHEYADRSPHATVPNVSTCMICHDSTKTESAEVQKLAGFARNNQQPPWVRVYYFQPSADAYFTHKPHVRAGIDCATCHGQVGQMRQVRREVEPTMGWCIDCHRQQSVSIDCYICHR
jgi:hypothetical protein